MSFIEGFNTIERAAAAAIRAEEGDYEVDGLLYCGKCNTPKQVRLEIFGEIRTPYCLCKCGEEERKRQDEERAHRARMERIEGLRKSGFAESDMHDWTFENDDVKNQYVSRIARNYAANFSTMKESGKGLLFFGTVGTGKTFAAACIANALIDKGIPVLMTNFARLTNTLSGMYEGKQEYIDNINRSFDLLIIDDLASERNTEFMGEMVFNIIDSRYRSGLPLIVTSNLTAEELKNPADMQKQRIYSRLFDMCIPIEVKGTDRRRDRLKGDVKIFGDLLGL